MFEVKGIEILDTATCIPVLAMRVNPSTITPREAQMFRRGGFGQMPRNADIYTWMMTLSGSLINYDSHNWRNQRTLGGAHRYIEQHWDELNSGDIIDMEYVLGESSAPRGTDLDY